MEFYDSFISAGAAEGGAAHPYLINDNNIDNIILYFTFAFFGSTNS